MKLCEEGLITNYKECIATHADLKQASNYSIRSAHLVTNVHPLKQLYSKISTLYNLTLVFLDSFPNAHFITKVTPRNCRQKQFEETRHVPGLKYFVRKLALINQWILFTVGHVMCMYIFCIIDKACHSLSF